MTPPDAGACARLMKQLNQCYVQALNRALDRTGPLWAGRFNSALVTSDRYALVCHRYIELNPVRAGMVPHPRAYRWSSYCANAEGRRDDLLQAHPTYAALGARPEARISVYRTLFEGELPDDDVEAIRRATRGGCRIGDPPKRRGPKKRKD
jgi:putative transposase